MTIQVIESTNEKLISAFGAGYTYAKPTDRVTQGKNAKGTLHWLIIENSEAEDNATYRLTQKGLRFHATGVEL